MFARACVYQGLCLPGLVFTITCVYSVDLIQLVGSLFEVDEVSVHDRNDIHLENQIYNQKYSYKK